MATITKATNTRLATARLFFYIHLINRYPLSFYVSDRARVVMHSYTQWSLQYKTHHAIL